MEFSAPTFNWPTIGALLLIGGTGFLVLLIGLFSKSVRLLTSFTLVGIALTFLYSASLWGMDETGFWGTAILDNFTLVFNFILLLSAFLALMLSFDFLKAHKQFMGEYCALICFATFGMMVMVSAGDLMMIFLGVETLSIALCILSGTRRTDPYSLEAAFKYFLIGAFASGFLLYGMAYLYGATGSTNLELILAFLGAGIGESNTYILVAAAFMVVGFGFKIALVPFHMWTPDVYEGAPTPIAAFMSTGVKAAGFAVLVRIFYYAMGTYFLNWQNMFWVLAVLTMTVGNIIALVQDNIKRMLAYSSIAHAGYILVGFAAGTDEAVSAVIYYLATYTFMNFGAFGIVSYFESDKKHIHTVPGFSGLHYKRPLLAAAMAVFMFALAGIPPTAGFFGKFYIFRAAVDAGLTGLAALGALNAVVGVYYYLRIVLVVYMREPESDFSVYGFRLSDSMVLTISVIGIFLLGLFPSFVLALDAGLAAGVVD